MSINKRRQFKYEMKWQEEEDYVNTVRTEWEAVFNGRPMGGLLRKLGCTRRRLKIWSKSLHGNPRRGSCRIYLGGGGVGGNGGIGLVRTVGD